MFESVERRMATSNIAVIMVGLPATGKTFTARSLSRYLRWLGVETRTFSVAHYRTRYIGTGLRADFFNPHNEDFLEKRTMIADMALDDMLAWFASGTPLAGEKGRSAAAKKVPAGAPPSSGSPSQAKRDGNKIGILDASNTRLERRRRIEEACRAANIRTVFLECIYTRDDSHADAVAEHFDELRLSCPEYETAATEDGAILDDFQRRIQFYRPHYVPVGGAAPADGGEARQASSGEDDISAISLYDGGEKIVASRLFGYLSSRILFYLMNLHRKSKRILLYGLPLEEGSCDGLSQWAKPLQRYLEAPPPLPSKRSSPPDGEGGATAPLAIWTETSAIGEALSTAVFAKRAFVTKPQLRRRDLGVMEGVPAGHAARMPGEAGAQGDPYYHRSDRGESYHDLSVRLENVMMELERSPHDVLILADASVLRCIYAYFVEVANELIPSVAIEPHAIVELQTRAYGVIERRIELVSEAALPDGHHQMMDSPALKARGSASHLARLPSAASSVEGLTAGLLCCSLADEGAMLAGAAQAGSGAVAHSHECALGRTDAAAQAYCEAPLRDCEAASSAASSAFIVGPEIVRPYADQV